MAVVKTGNEVIGEMPYTATKRGLWQVSYLPPLTRTLGPVITRQPADAGGPEWVHRLDVTRELIAQLPRFGHFQQIADPLVSEAEAAAFALGGFKVSVQFTLKLPAGLDEETVWRRLRWNTRNRIRRSSERFVVKEIADVDAFVNLYDSNLSARELDNVYGSTIMRRLLTEVLRREAGAIIGSFDSDGSLTAATALVWDRANLYYILTTRKATAHSGAVALLIWQAIKIARERNLELDFDGVSTAGILQFLSGFGGHLVRRYVFEYMRADFALIRSVRACSRELVKLARRNDAEKSAQAE
ncbi:GNAT family N-acetyltransferase [Paraburkholderia youngii]|uniref:GNAT family N-acetyltransferase n=1 Tax=Paraburkholderia youngii TaxID=2782701 RepID=UPI001595FCF8|nr:GNAT family N-acetyltransferase [Paraburkholderia youngii]